MRILITGVSGFVGYHTAALAVHEGHSVIAIGRSPLSQELTDLGVIEFKWLGWPTDMSIGPLSQLIGEIGHIDAVIHAAGDAHYGDGEHYVQSNVRPTELLIEFLQITSPDTKFVFVSSVGAQDFPRFGSSRLHNELTKPLPRSDYGKSKLVAENLVAESGLSYAIARLGMVIGRRMREDSHVSVLLRTTESTFMRRLMASFRGVLPLVHVNDAANALLLLCEPKATSGTYLVVSDNCPIHKVLNSPRGLKSSNGFLGLWWTAGLLPAKLSTVMSAVMRFDSSKIRAIGWNPEIETEVALAEVYSQVMRSNEGFHVVTGVASGLGNAFMLSLIEHGHSVIGVDINPEAIQGLRSTYPDQMFLCADVSDTNLFDNLLSIAQENNSVIASLYLIAGIGFKSKLIDLNSSAIRRQFEINVLSRVLLSRDFLRYLRQSQFRGRLVLVSSSTALQPLPEFSVYGSTNAALLSFGRSLISETSYETCQIIVLVPGGMDTNFQTSAGVRRLDKERLLDPKIIANQIVSNSSTKSIVRVIGRNAKVAQVGARFLPMSILDKLWSKLTKVAR